MYLRDGRNALVQWDLDRQLVVEDPNVTRVHYCNKLTTEALVCEVKQDGELRVVDIPNVLLQTPWDIKAYCMCDCYVREILTLTIKAKTKPADYVYTETDVFKVEELVEKEVEKEVEKAVEELEANITGNIGAALAEIIAIQESLLGGDSE